VNTWDRQRFYTYMYYYSSILVISTVSTATFVSLHRAPSIKNIILSSVSNINSSGFLIPTSISMSLYRSGAHLRWHKAVRALGDGMMFV
jgi:hypothetical protein